MSAPIYFLNDSYVSADHAQVRVDDLGILRGYGIFDFLRTYSRVPFKLREHLVRLNTSAQLIGLPIPWTIDALDEIVHETLRRNPGEEVGIRIVVTGGSSDDFITPCGAPNLAVMVTPLHPVPASYFEQGIAVVTTRLARSLPEAKTINYVPGIMALAQAKQHSAVEAIYLDGAEHLLEGTTTNFFAFQGERLFTATSGILPGITRNVVLELAQDRYQIVAQPIAYADLAACDEAFLTSTTKEVMPIVQVDNIRIGDGRPGARTRELLDLFRRTTRQTGAIRP